MPETSTSKYINLAELQRIGFYEVTTDDDYLAPANASFIYWNVGDQSQDRTISFQGSPGQYVTVFIANSAGFFVGDNFTPNTIFYLTDGNGPSNAIIQMTDSANEPVLSLGTAAQYNIGTSSSSIPLNSSVVHITGAETITGPKTINASLPPGTKSFGIQDGGVDRLIFLQYTFGWPPGVGGGPVMILGGTGALDGALDFNSFRAMGGASTYDFVWTTKAVGNSAMERLRITGNLAQSILTLSDTSLKVSATGGQIAAILLGTATWDPGSTLTGTVATTTVAVTGAVPGNVAMASWEDTTPGWIVSAFVSANDVVTVNALFMGTVSDDPGSITLRVWVIKQ